jgi:uncharacterized protein YraI
MKNFANSNIFPRWVKPAFACFIALTASIHAETGVVRATRCNVRARPDTKSEVVTTVNKGDTVTILERKSTGTGKDSQWLRIALPSAATCYVHSQFIKDGTITNDDVYVRPGPGTNFRDIGKLPKGEKVTVTGTKGEWTQIKPTSHCSAWISADLVNIETSAAPAMPAVTPAPIAPAVPVTADIKPAAPPATVTQPAIVPVSPAPPAPAVPIVTIKEADPAEYSISALKTGILRRVSNPTDAPASYELMTPERNRITHRICYLDTTNMNLSRYEGRQVRVFGNLRWREKERDPVMIVTRVDMVW